MSSYYSPTSYIPNDSSVGVKPVKESPVRSLNDVYIATPGTDSDGRYRVFKNTPILSLSNDDYYFPTDGKPSCMPDDIDKVILVTNFNSGTYYAVQQLVNNNQLSTAFVKAVCERYNIPLLEVTL